MSLVLSIVCKATISSFFGYSWHADQIPFYVNISQKNNRNISDFIFIKDIPIMFDVRIHDPSHYLNHSAISYHWNFGDGSGSFVSNNSISIHTYTLLGNFSADLSVQAIIPVPCGPVTPSPLSTFPGKYLWQLWHPPYIFAQGDTLVWFMKENKI